MKIQLKDLPKEKIVKNLLTRYEKNLKQLEKIRDCSALKDGWGTQKLAKKQRKCEELSKENQIIREVLFNDWGIEI